MLVDGELTKKKKKLKKERLFKDEDVFVFVRVKNGWRLKMDSWIMSSKRLIEMRAFCYEFFIYK